MVVKCGLKISSQCQLFGIKRLTLSRVTEFSIHTKQPLWILFFLHILPWTNASKLKYVLFYQFLCQDIHIFGQESSAPTYDLTSKYLVENDILTDVIMSNRHPDIMYISLHQSVTWKFLVCKETNKKLSHL